MHSASLFPCLILLLCSSCSLWVKNQVNERWPPASTEEIKIRSIQNQLTNMVEVKRPDFSAHFTNPDILINLDSSLRRVFRTTPDFDVALIKSFQMTSPPEVFLQDQLLGIKMRLKVNFKDTTFRVRGVPVNLGKKTKEVQISFEGFVSPYVLKNHLTITPTIVNVRFEKLKLRSLFGGRVLKAAFNYVFNEFRDNINGYFHSHPGWFSIPLDIKPLPEKYVSELLEGNESLTVVRDMKIDINKTIGPIVLRMSATGIDLFGQVVDTKDADADPDVPTGGQLTAPAPQAFDLAPDAKIYKNRLKVGKYHANHQAEVFSEKIELKIQMADRSIYGAAYSDAPILRSEIPDVKLIYPEELSRKQARMMRKQEVPASSVVVSSGELFGNFSELFDRVWGSAFDEIAIDTSEVYVSKKFISLLVNEVFADPDLVLQFVFKEDKDPNTKWEPVKVIDEPPFDCKSVLHDCNHILNEPCHGRRNCNFDCSWYEPWCYAAEGVCHVRNGLVWTACQVGKGVRYAGCEAENAGKFAWCSLEFLGTYLLYQALYIGDYRALAALNAQGTFHLRNMSVTEGLDEASIMPHVKATGAYDVDFDYRGRSIAWLLCPSIDCNFAEPFNAEVNDVLVAKFESVKARDVADTLKIVFPKIPIQIRTKSLFHQVMQRCPETLVTCPITMFGIRVAKVIHSFVNDGELKNYLDGFFEGRYTHTIKDFKMKFEVPSFELVLPNGMRTATSQIGSKSVSYHFIK